MLLPRRLSFTQRFAVVVLLCLLIFWASRLVVWGDPAANPPTEDFGRYLFDHQSELVPFFDKNSSELLGQAVPLLLQWIGRIVLISLAVGWGVDCLLGRGYATLFAPSLGRFRSALIYATGRLALNVIVVIFLGSAIVASVGNPRLEAILVALLILFTLVSAFLQVGWITFLYKTNLPISILFYLTLVVVHGFLTLGIARPLSGLPASPPAIAFMDRTVTPKIQTETQTLREELAAKMPESSKVIAESEDLQNQLEESRLEQAQLRKQIDDAKSSGSYLYSQIVKIHARGDLAAAHDQFTALLARYPNGPMTGLAKGQLNQVNSELAAQAAQRQQAAATKLRMIAQGRALLLSHTGKGRATLSEIRGALLGKSPAEVSSLFGPPSETASNRWGFSRQMVFNPLTNETSGLAIYFADGLVQGVDYYYGTGGGQ